MFQFVAERTDFFLKKVADMLCISIFGVDNL